MQGKPIMNRRHLMQTEQWLQLSTRINQLTEHYA